MDWLKAMSLVALGMITAMRTVLAAGGSRSRGSARLGAPELGLQPVLPAAGLSLPVTTKVSDGDQTTRRTKYS